MNNGFEEGFIKVAGSRTMALKSGADFVKSIASKRAANKAKPNYLKNIMKSSPKKQPKAVSFPNSTEMSARGKKQLEGVSSRARFQKAMRDDTLPKGQTSRAKV